jgi:hypothetical protein
LKVFRDCVVVLAAGAVAYCALGYQRPAKPLATRVVMLDPTVDPRMRASLSAIDFQQIKLRDALQAIADKAGMRLVVDTNLELPLDAPIDLHLRNATVGGAMSALLKAVDGDWFALTQANGVITVTTQDRIDQSAKVVVRVYDVHQLVGKAAKLLPETLGYSVFLTPSTTLVPATSSVYAAEAEETDQIIRFITDNVMPDSWKDNGGSIGSISHGSSVLVIEQTERAHAQIAELLRLLDR